MDGIYFTQKRIEGETEETYIKSKFLGTPVFPEGLLYDENDEFILYDTEYYIMQLNLEEIAGKNPKLPQKGMLYFFIDVDTLEPRVIYAKSLENCRLEIIDDINDHFEEEVFGETNGYELVFENNLEEGHYVFGDVNPDLDLETDTDIDGYVTLLEIDFLSLPHDNMLRFGELGISDGRYIFLIKEEDLENLDFSNIKFIDKED